MLYFRNVIISFFVTFGTTIVAVPATPNLTMFDDGFKTLFSLIISGLTGLLSIIVTTWCRDWLECRRQKRKRVSEYHNWLTQRYDNDSLSNPQIAASSRHETSTVSGRNSHN